ncbi:MAG: metal-dependent transcriptional regulator [Acidimicrobiales bacterium]
MTLKTHRVTPAVQDYLKEIFHFGVDGRAVSTNELSERLGVAAPSVTAMLKRLAAEGLVEHHRYHGVRLTADGEAAALRVVRRHRLTETFLRQVLNVPWDEVHDEAEILEHAISDRLEDRIDALLGQPTRDCHGDPIPPKRGEHREVVDTPLHDVPIGARVRIERVSDRDLAVLRTAAARHIALGREMTVVGRDEPEGTVRLRHDDHQHRLGRAVVAAVSVTVVEEGAA